MKNYPDFDTAEHCANRYYREGEWDTDFDTIPPRRYKEVMQGVRIYEGGLFQIRSHLYRNDSFRSRIAAEFGIDVGLVRARTGYQYFMPDRTPVTKDAIIVGLAGSTGYFLYDHRHGMAVRMVSWNADEMEAVSYYGPNARPVGGRDITLRIVDKEAYKWNLAKLRPTRDLALSYAAVSPDAVHKTSWGESRVRANVGLVENELHSTLATDSNRVRQNYSVPSVKKNHVFLLHLGLLDTDLHGDRVNQLIGGMSRRPVTVPYLYFKT